MCFTNPAKLDTLPVEIVQTIGKNLVLHHNLRTFYIFDFVDLNSLATSCKYFRASLNEMLYKTAIKDFTAYNKCHRASKFNPPRRLSRLVKEDKVKGLKVFIHFGLPYKFRMGEHPTIYHMAIRRGSYKIVKFLVEAKHISTSKRYGKSGMTLLHIAAAEPRKNEGNVMDRQVVFDYLAYQTKKIDAKDRTDEPKSALQYALKNGVYKFVETLVANGADPRNCIFRATGRRNMLEIVREAYRPAPGAEPLPPKWRATIFDAEENIEYREGSDYDSSETGWEPESESSEEEEEEYEPTWEDDDHWDWEHHSDDEDANYVGDESNAGEEDDSEQEDSNNGEEGECSAGCSDEKDDFGNDADTESIVDSDESNDGSEENNKDTDEGAISTAGNATDSGDDRDANFTDATDVEEESVGDLDK